MDKEWYEKRRNAHIWNKMNKTKSIRIVILSTIILISIVIYITSCTIGVSHRVIINEYGDSDSSASNNKKFINNLYYSDTTKHKTK